MSPGADLRRFRSGCFDEAVGLRPGLVCDGRAGQHPGDFLAPFRIVELTHAGTRDDAVIALRDQQMRGTAGGDLIQGTDETTVIRGGAGGDILISGTRSIAVL